MSKHSRSMMWSLAWIWLVVLFCNIVYAAAPDWQVVIYPNYTCVLARVKIDGVPIHSDGSLLAAFHGEELRGVAEIIGANPDDDIDGEYYFNLLFGSNQSGETGFTFKLWNSADDQVYDLDKTLDFDTNYPTKPEIYGGFTAAGFVPCVMNAVIPNGKHTLTVVKGTINGTTATTAEFTTGEEITITATLPTNQGLKIWTPDNDVEFIGSILAPTTTIRMPAHDVTITASFIAKSSMQAVSVRSTTNAGDDTAQEPSSASATADKGKFTFTRTSSSGSLTVYFDIRGTAANSVDYKTIQSSVTFASGKTSVELPIEPLFDGVTEGDETVEVVLIPATPTQTYRGGTYTNATLTIKDPEFATVQYTLLPDEAVMAGAQWKIDDGDWVNSSVTVTTNTGSHVISFKDVAGYTAPASQTITLAANEAKNGTAAYEISDGKYTLTVVKGTINGTSATTAQFAAGEEVTIAATLPSNQGLKIWTPDKDVEFIGSILASTTTIKMPPYDVTVTASFIAKSSMQAVAVRSTTNAGDDTAKEPASATASADKGKFTFTRTSSSGSLTVYFDIRGTAANGVDYKTIQSSVTFASGKTSVECEIEPLFDGVTEGDETVQVVLIPATPTQTYRGGAVTDATITIQDTPVPVNNPTASVTLYPSAVITAGGQWKIDENGAWNDSGAIVTTTVGTHTIYFKDVTNYATPDSQTVTLAAGAAWTSNATYVYNAQNPTVKFTLYPAEAVAAGAKWRIDDGDWNDSGVTVTSTAGVHTITFKDVEGYTTPATLIINPGTMSVVDNNATYIPIGGGDPFHPADCRLQDYFVSGVEFLEYAGPVKAAALGNYEYEWDGSDVLSLTRKASRGSDLPKTRNGGIAITRQVSSTKYMEGSSVEVTLSFEGWDRMLSLFIGEKIPEGWTVVGEAASYVSNGVLRAAWESTAIPSSFTYIIQAPSVNLAASYVIASNSKDTGCFADDTLLALKVEDTVLTNNYHPADCIDRDGRISGLEYLKYSGPVKAAAVGNYMYTWDGVDVLSFRRKDATRGGAAAADVAIARSIDMATYEATSLVNVTLTISGAEGMVSLFVGERIPEGWNVVGNYADNVRNGVLRMAWDAPNIPETVTYTLQAPAENLSANCKISSSSVDTGCFVERVLFLDAGETILTNQEMEKTAEWPQDMTLYTPADGKNYRETDNLAVTFNWPSIQNAESYRLIVAAYDGTIVFDGTVEETAFTIRGMERGSYIWNVTAIGDDCIAGTTWQDFRFAVVPFVSVPIITSAIADGTTVRLAFDKTEASYTDGVFTYQVVFYSLENQTLTNMEQTVAVANGKAVIDLGMAASNGYLYIRPVTTPESEFTELYVK